MRKLLVCLLVMVATLAACVQIRTVQKGADEPVISFDLVTLTPTTDATPRPHTATPTSTPRPTDRPVPTRTTTSPSTSASTPTSTATPVPTDTPSPTPCLPDATFVTDVTIPDDTVYLAGEAFQKVWCIRSSGCAPWPDGARWVFVSGEQMGAASSVAVPDTPAGGTADIAVQMVAPDAPGTYKGFWQMQLPDGTRFGDRAYVQIVVPAPTSVPRAKPSKPRATQVSTPEPPPP